MSGGIQAAVAPRPGPWMALSFRVAAVLLALVVGEASVRLAMVGGWVLHRPVRLNHMPGEFLEDLNPHFGVWRYPNRTFSGMSSNEHGMRDRPRALLGDGRSRIAVLGDSFVEGFGVRDGERMLDHLESLRGLEHLNFGVSGGFGPVQAWLCYEHMVAPFEHSEVWLFCLPDNDFTDLEPRDPGRYRPYLRPAPDGGYEVYYTVPFGERKAMKRPSLATRLRQAAIHESALLNALSQLRLGEQAQGQRDRPPGYDHFAAHQGEQLVYAYGQIARLAAPRPLTVFVIPRAADLEAAQAGRLEGRAVKLLAEFAAGHANVRLVDLLPGFLHVLEQERLPVSALFLPRDGHWSVLGNRVAAQLVREAVDGDAPWDRARREAHSPADQGGAR